MKTRIIYIALSALILTGGFLGIKKLTSTAASQTTTVDVQQQHESDRIQILQNTALRASDWKLVVVAIEQEKSCAEVRGKHGKDTPSAEMIKALVDLLDWERPRSSMNLGSIITDNHPGQKTYYPAIWALAAWKEFAQPAVVDVLESENPDSIKWQNAFTVIRQDFGYEDAKVAKFFGAQATQAKSEEGRKRLLSAADRALAEKKKLEDARLRDSKKP